ncbi:O-antigen ligase family protein [Muribaculum intestinale]|uniref:O-antigen ligase family protein n=2 Tax=Bacteroidales TaxID=171549 RepID=UPI000F465F22|nr:hypothetical protein EEL35_09395 [Muribaculaceae bacterium Isolate-042 (Harlan)]ROT06234.1 hypothetical protein EEL42_08860 [Muribaculaceae bacterium Isolate-100 (HZI)]RXE64965.1 hypothetical protein ED388_09325 [Muribaculaceae bacterium Isolate-007 (NCI)]TGX86637.1 hypothetical protein E5360_03285 [Muribaculum intestinale]
MASFAFYLAVISSMLSQTPAFLESGVDQYLKLTWILPLVVLIFDSPRAFINRKLFFFYSFVLLFLLYCLILQSLKDVEYMGADLYNIAISLMVTIVSFAYWTKHGSATNIKFLVVFLLISALYLTITVYTQFLASTSLSQLKYAFDAKNSMGQILLNVIIVTITCYIPRQTIFRILFVLGLCIMVIVIFMLKSRATLCGFFFVILYYIVKYNNPKIRVYITCLTIFAVTYILCDSTAYEVVVEQIIFGNRDASNVDDLSSGRVYLMKQLLPGIYESPWFGSGNKYMDCFPIIMIAQYGIIGASIVFIFLLYVASLISIKFKPRLNYNLATYLLFWAAMINSLFEANPPFGPGIKCFIIWMLFGISLSKFSPLASHTKRYLYLNKTQY